MSTNTRGRYAAPHKPRTYLAAHGRGPDADTYRGVTCRCHAGDPNWSGHSGTVTSCSSCECAVWYLLRDVEVAS